MTNPISQEIVKYSLPTSPFVYVRDHIIQKMGNAFEKGVTVVTNILKDYPEFMPYAFDVATHIEKEGDKQAADKIRRTAASVVKTSPPVPSIQDDHFMTPPLTGPYPVGVRAFYLEDPDRNEQNLGHHINRTRRLDIKIYYPANQVDVPKYKVNPPLFFSEFDKLDNLWTRSQPDISPYSDQKFPVVIFSHGWGCDQESYQHIVEELASHGFCVITVNHPFTSWGSNFTGNFPDENIYPEDVEEQEGIQEVLTNSNDLQFVIRQIKESRIEGFQELFGESIDADSIGVFGHSLGGAASLQTCRELSFIKAGINMDGPCDPDPTGEERINQPFLTMIASCETEEEKTLRGWKDDQPSYPTHELATEVTIPNAIHRDFTSFSLGMAKFQQREPSSRAMRIYNQTNRTVVEFFTKHLK